MIIQITPVHFLQNSIGVTFYVNHCAFVRYPGHIYSVNQYYYQNVILQAAEQAAVSTAEMTARAGRASYVSREHLTQPDPGAHAVGIWMRATYEAMKLVQC